MGTRVVDMTVVVVGVFNLHFDLTCDTNARFVEMQVFEIVSPGRESVRVRPVTVINRSDGKVLVRAVNDIHSHTAETVLARLQRMPNVNNLRKESP